MVDLVFPAEGVSCKIEFPFEQIYREDQIR